MAISTPLASSELRAFFEKNDLRAAWMVLFNWALIAAAFALPALWFNPVTVLLAVFLLGGRQLGLGVIMHDCSHHALFKTRRLNNFVGQYLCAYPILSDLYTYRETHRAHHRLAGTTEDPDLSNYQAYPVSRAGFRRKVIRDLTGQTGLKVLKNLFKGGGELFMTASERQKRRYSLRGPLLVNGCIFLVLSVCGHGALYLLWPLAYFTSYMLVSRLRQIAEHAAVPDALNRDPRQNTRTTYASWWERLLIAPNHVHYHLDHHVFPSVPPYHLKGLHQRLKAEGFYNGVRMGHGYRDVLQQVMT